MQLMYGSTLLSAHIDIISRARARGHMTLPQSPPYHAPCLNKSKNVKINDLASDKGDHFNILTLGGGLYYRCWS